MKTRPRIIVLLLTLCMFAAVSHAQVNFPGGRIAMSYDGNSNDEDDYGAMPIAIAMVAKAGLANKLVHVEHGNNICENTNNRSNRMNNLCESALQRFGPFPNVKEYQVMGGEQNAASNNLAAEINASSANDPLWIIAAGPMHTVAAGIRKAQQNKRQHAVVVSHSNWNEVYDRCNNHTDWQEMKNEFSGQGILFIETSGNNVQPNNITKLVNQNGQNGNNSGGDFHTAKSEWNWLKNSSNPDYVWLFNNNTKNGYDVSDAGMVYFVISGGVNLARTQKNGCETCGSTETEALFEGDPGCTGFTNISDLVATVQNCSTVALDWSSVPCAIEYIVRRKLPSAATFTNLGNVNATNFTDNTVAENTSYIYQVRPFDGTTKLTSNLPQADVIACGGGDTQAPSVPGATSYSNIAQNSVTVSWGASTDNVAVTGYDVFMNGSLQTSVSGTSANITGLSCETSYAFKVRAFDAAGNQSAFNTETSTNTASCPTGGGVFFIDHNSSGQRLKATATGGAVGVKAATSTGVNVQWEEVDAGGGFFFLVHQASSNKLHSSDGLTVNTTAPTATGNNVQWTWVDAGGGWYRLEHRGSGNWLHIKPDGVTDFGLGPNTWTGNNTKWKFTAVGGSTARLATENGLFNSEMQSNNNLRLYPNPAEHVLNIGKVNTDVMLRITDLKGQLIKLVKPQPQIDISGLKAGVYLLQIPDHATIRFVKQ